jgi:hypothetical protein
MRFALLLCGVLIFALAATIWLRVERIRAQRSSPVRGASQLAAYAGQQIEGTPGSPSATTTINGEQLPPPPTPFGGRIERNASQATAYWPARVVPPKGAPNILLILTDDTGFGVTTTMSSQRTLRTPSTRSGA